jgi:TPP-dependent pyruvate/acetoin dehydrogenase alpha subunit
VDRGVGEAILDEIDADVSARVDEATERAKAAPLPDERLIFTDVWADGSARWRN